MNEALYTQHKYSPYINTIKYPKVSTIVNNIYSNNIINSRYTVDNDKVRSNLISLIVSFIKYDHKLAISKRNNQIIFLKHQWFTYRKLLRALELLEQHEFITLKSEGFWNRKYKTGIASVYETTDKFKEVFKDVEKQDLEIINVPGIRVKKKRLKDCKNINNINSISNSIYNSSNIGNNNILHYDNARNEEEDNKEVDKLNKEYWNKVYLTFPNTSDSDNVIKNVNLTRKFKDYDGKIGGGRFYQEGGLSYLTIPKSERRGLLINGKEIVECDYSGLFPTMLYHYIGQQSPYEDNYKAVMKELNIDESDARLRRIIKIAVNAMINAESVGSYNRCFNPKRPSKIPRTSTKPTKYEEKIYLESKGYTLMDIYNASIKVHKPIICYIGTGIGVFLQKFESDIIMNVIKRLKHENIIALPIHDCMACQTGNGQRVKEIMQEEYKKQMKFDIKVKLKEV